MRLFGRILNVFTSVIVLLIGLAMTVIEGYLLFTADFLLYQLPYLAFLQMLLRFLIALGLIALGVFTIIKPDRAFVIEGVAILLAALMTYPFLTNNFGLYFSLIAAAYTASNLFYQLKCLPKNENV